MQKSHPSIIYLFILNGANPQAGENLFYLPVMANYPSSFPPSLSPFLLYFDTISGDNFKYNTKNSYIPFIKIHRCSRFAPSALPSILSWI